MKRNKYSQDIKQKVLRLRDKNFSSVEISGLLGIPKPTVCLWIKGKRLRACKIPNWRFDLSKPEHAYIFGFIQTDGHIHINDSGKSGQLTIEISSQDRSLLEKFRQVIPYDSSISTRIRTDTFKNGSSFDCFRISRYEFLAQLLTCGLKSGNKKFNVKPPDINYSELDYWRGIIDGDGSLGFKNNGIPFISLSTSSESLKYSYIIFLESILKKKMIRNKNKENHYHIDILKEDAVKIVCMLYYDGCLSLDRKNNLATKIKRWERSKYMEQRRRWSAEEDEIILNNLISNAMIKIDRTKRAIEMRLARLRLSCAKCVNIW